MANLFFKCTININVRVDFREVERYAALIVYTLYYLILIFYALKSTTTKKHIIIRTHPTTNIRADDHDPTPAPADIFGKIPP